MINIKRLKTIDDDLSTYGVFLTGNHAVFN